MREIVVVGGLNMDLHVFGLRGSADDAPLVADRYLAQPGGKGANVARALARLGAPVRLVGVVGDDEFGRDCVSAVAADGVDVGAVRTTRDAPTGFVVIELREGKHRSLVFAGGANACLHYDDVEPSVADLGADDVVIVQAEVPTVVLDGLTDLADRTGVRLYLDPTPPAQTRGRHLRCAEVITPDLLEAARLVGRQNSSELWPSMAARELLACGAQRVIIKLGEGGALLATRGSEETIPTLGVQAVDETGAGDVFLAALAVRRREGASWGEATRFANAASALSVAGPGLTLPTRALVDQACATIAAQP